MCQMRIMPPNANVNCVAPFGGMSGQHHNSGKSVYEVMYQKTTHLCKAVINLPWLLSKGRLSSSLANPTLSSPSHDITDFIYQCFNNRSNGIVYHELLDNFDLVHQDNYPTYHPSSTMLHDSLAIKQRHSVANPKTKNFQPSTLMYPHATPFHHHIQKAAPELTKPKSNLSLLNLLWFGQRNATKVSCTDSIEAMDRDTDDHVTESPKKDPLLELPNPQRDVVCVSDTDSDNYESTTDGELCSDSDADSIVFLHETSENSSGILTDQSCEDDSSDSDCTVEFVDEDLFDSIFYQSSFCTVNESSPCTSNNFDSFEFSACIKNRYSIP